MGGTGLVAVYIKWSTGQDSMFYVCKDRQGSIVALIKQNGTVSERFSYDAWGRRRNPANWADYNVPAPRLINRGYTGHEHLDGFGLINMNGRMYDPVIGRVLSPDNYVQDPTNTQCYNRYSYCLNNPLRYTDPSGWLSTISNNDLYEQYVNNQFNWLDGIASNPNRNPGCGDYNGGSGFGFFAMPGYTRIQGQDGLVWVPSSDVSYMNSTEIDKLTDGFSLYSFNAFGRDNWLLSIGDPRVISATGGAYKCNNPSAASFVSGKAIYGKNSVKVSNNNQLQLPTVTKTLTTHTFPGKGLSLTTYTKAVKEGNSNLVVNLDRGGAIESFTYRTPSADITIGPNTYTAGNAIMSFGTEGKNYIIDVSIPIAESSIGGFTIAFDKDMTDLFLSYSWMTAVIVFPQLQTVKVPH